MEIGVGSINDGACCSYVPAVLCMVFMLRASPQPNAVPYS